jgi:hypothetical protein
VVPLEAMAFFAYSPDGCRTIALTAENSDAAIKAATDLLTAFGIEAGTCPADPAGAP